MVDRRPASEQESDRQRKRRLAEVFGDVLPETTADDRPAPSGTSADTERWYAENRPPHHG